MLIIIIIILIIIIKVFVNTRLMKKHTFLSSSKNHKKITKHLYHYYSYVFPSKSSTDTEISVYFSLQLTR